MKLPLARTSVLRTPALVAAAVALLLSGTACGGDDSDTITVYSGRSENLIGPLMDRFEETSGRNVEVRYADSVDLALRLAEEQDGSPADVFISTSPGAIESVAADGLLATLPPEVAQLGIVLGNDTSLAVSGRQRVLVYNTDNVDTADLPDSIYDLTDASFDGRLGIAPTNASFQDWFTVFRNDVGDETADEWLTELVEGDVQTYENNNAIVQAVARGEIDFGLVNHYYNARLLDEDPGSPSANHRFEEGDPGGTMLATAVGMLASGDTEAAAELITFLMSEEAQTYFADETFEYPLAEGVEPSPSLDPPAEYDFGSLAELGGQMDETLDAIRNAGLEV